jgi:hypothetical protein
MKNRTIIPAAIKPSEELPVTVFGMLPPSTAHEAPGLLDYYFRRRSNASVRITRFSAPTAIVPGIRSDRTAFRIDALTVPIHVNPWDILVGPHGFVSDRLVPDLGLEFPVVLVGSDCYRAVNCYQPTEFVPGKTPRPLSITCVADPEQQVRICLQLRDLFHRNPTLPIYFENVTPAEGLTGGTIGICHGMQFHGFSRPDWDTELTTEAVLEAAGNVAIYLEYVLGAEDVRITFDGTPYELDHTEVDPVAVAEKFGVGRRGAIGSASFFPGSIEELMRYSIAHELGLDPDRLHFVGLD